MWADLEGALRERISAFERANAPTPLWGQTSLAFPNEILSL